MTVKELLKMLKAANPNAKVWAEDIYDGRGIFQIHGMEYDNDTVDLTNEETDEKESEEG